MSLLELQGLTIDTETGYRPPPGSRASKGCHTGSYLSLLCHVL
ncbi:SapB/AmfS family lanthipeptide [Streptomyces sp. NPDC086554]